MAIEIRNLSISSKVVQRQAAQPGAGDAAPQDPKEDCCKPPSDWRVECRRMIQELLELQRER
ncbi:MULTISPECIES: DUF5908 family protein [Massilia]|uniref:Uncharacterized protein n=1 Tax=Massilia aurea TaxID=373040 RepID=A0A422QQP9_9BURK|nr:MULTISPECIES: DUF5908 family protein [Massilia]MDY0961160.1 DUF5908 family protein [Massilia sp. CFBP9026]RNF32348.1 hypothetical protein NM04_02330 [Massilia aurea]